jgi:ATP-dependent DNA helicase RecG
VEKIRAGNSNIRNPILISYIAKGLLPYKGLGSGIKRALEEWPQIEFTDDREGCLFTVTVRRSSEKSSEKTKSSLKSSPKSSLKTEDKIVERIRQDIFITTEKLGKNLGISKRAILKQIEKLKKQGRLRRIGPARGGHWEIIE